MFSSSYKKTKGILGFSMTTIIIIVGLLAYSMRWLESMSFYPQFLKDSTFLKIK